MEVGRGMTTSEWRRECEDYLSRRTGTYDFRCRRYDAVLDELTKLGVGEWDVVYDLGAGMCEFDRRARERGQHFRYVPVDGCIDGTDLNEWIPTEVDAFVAIEVIEHLFEPFDFLRRLARHARKGVVVTTPNPLRVDVLGMDPTHRHRIFPSQLEGCHFQVTRLQLFNDFEDTLLATRSTEARSRITRREETR